MAAKKSNYNPKKETSSDLEAFGGDNADLLKTAFNLLCDNRRLISKSSRFDALTSVLLQNQDQLKETALREHLKHIEEVIQSGENRFRQMLAGSNLTEAECDRFVVLLGHRFGYSTDTPQLFDALAGTAIFDSQIGFEERHDEFALVRSSIDTSHIVVAIDDCIQNAPPLVEANIRLEYQDQELDHMVEQSGFKTEAEKSIVKTVVATGLGVQKSQSRWWQRFKATLKQEARQVFGLRSKSPKSKPAKATATSSSSSAKQSTKPTSRKQQATLTLIEGRENLTFGNGEFVHMESPQAPSPISSARANSREATADITSASGKESSSSNTQPSTPKQSSNAQRKPRRLAAISESEEDDEDNTASAQATRFETAAEVHEVPGPRLDFVREAALFREGRALTVGGRTWMAGDGRRLTYSRIGDIRMSGTGEIFAANAGGLSSVAAILRALHTENPNIPMTFGGTATSNAVDTADTLDAAQHETVAASENDTSTNAPSAFRFKPTTPATSSNKSNAKPGRLPTSASRVGATTGATADPQATTIDVVHETRVAPTQRELQCSNVETIDHSQLSAAIEPTRISASSACQEERNEARNQQCSSIRGETWTLNTPEGRSLIYDHGTVTIIRPNGERLVGHVDSYDTVGDLVRAVRAQNLNKATAKDTSEIESVDLTALSSATETTRDIALMVHGKVLRSADIGEDEAAEWWQLKEKLEQIQEQAMRRLPTKSFKQSAADANGNVVELTPTEVAFLTTRLMQYVIRLMQSPHQAEATLQRIEELLKSRRESKK